MIRVSLYSLFFLAFSTSALANLAPENLDIGMSYTFIDQLTGAEAEDKLAWVESQRGVRNVWMIQRPHGEPQRLTDGTEDDGQQITSLAFSPEGKLLVWVRGGGEHNSWANALPPPNPASATVQPELEIWLSVDGGKPVKVAEGEEPVVSRTGRIAFLREGQAFVVDAWHQAAPQKLFYDRGIICELAWSPDGSKLAFKSNRGDHSFIGVYIAPTKPILWISPATASDSNPVWSPDGARIAFSRQPGLPDVLSSPLVDQPQPFSIWVGSALDGSAVLLWQSPPTANGSYPELPDGLNLMWASDERLIFRAEIDGWPHLYALPLKGGKPILLTAGEFMVEHVAMTHNHHTLLFSANTGLAADDQDRRHIFSVSLDAGASNPRLLTSGTGVEWMPIEFGRDIAFIGSHPKDPTAVFSIPLDGGRSEKISQPRESMAFSSFVDPQAVTFTAPDGLKIHGQLFLPRTSGIHPGLIFVHGGPQRQMLLGWSYIDYYSHAYALNQYLAARGFVVLSVNYRLGIGYGRAFEHPARAGIAGNSELQDVVAGAHFLQSQAFVDPARIGIWGGSYGGLLTANALARRSDLFKVGVDYHGVSDWTLYPKKIRRPDRYEQGDFELVERTAFESSPDAAIDQWRSPVLLIHGDDDRNVRFDQTTDLARRLFAHGTLLEEVILPNEIHGFLRYDSWMKADTAAVRFLERYLNR